MSRWRVSQWVLCVCVALLFLGGGCNSSGTDASGEESGAGACDPDTTPIVFAHGALEVGDAFANQSMRFASNGYCLDRIFAFDYNTISFGSLDEEVARLAAFIGGVLEETGAAKVDLVGHSMGTLLSRLYLDQDPAHAASVAHYANLAGLSADAPPGGVPTISLSSEDDHIVGTSHIEGAENVLLEGTDHLEVATSAATFRNLYRFFNDGREPRTEEPVPTGYVTLSGRLLTFAENQAAPGRTLEIYPVDPTTGERLQASPVAGFVSEEDGSWGPFQAEPGRHYEYVVKDENPFWPPIHYYREPLPRSCDLVYFRVFPSPLSLIGCPLGLLVHMDPEAMVLATLNINQAVIDTRDELFVGGFEISIPEVTAAEKTALAIFYTDFPGTEEGEAPRLNDPLIFIQGFDLDVDTGTPAPVPVEFNGRPVSVRNWKSGSDGVTIAVFE